MSVRGRVAPNEFEVHLNPADFQPFEDHGSVLSQDLAEWLEDLALAAGLSTAGNMQVKFVVDESVRQGRFEIHSCIAESEPDSLPYADPGQTEAFAVMNPQRSGPSGYIELCSGPSTGAMFSVRKQVVTIGRDLSNDLVIDSAEVSRFHAELHSTPWTTSIIDRQSLNGTFINGMRLAGTGVIEPGDQIMFGTTICRYWRELL